MNDTRPSDAAALDRLTGGAFTAPTAGERAARVRAWLDSDPSLEQMQEVFRELSHRDKGAARPLRERLDETRRQRLQDTLADEWAAKARALIEQPRLNLADGMAWQRDAAKAGAPLSREPLASLRQALAERMKALEDLQHRVQVQRESAVLLAQRIEILSTRAWTEAREALDGLRGDVQRWRDAADLLLADPAWAALDPRFALQLDGSRQQLDLVWQAFEAALAQAQAAAADPAAALPAVPVWAEELRQARAASAPEPGPASDPAAAAAQAERRAKADAAVSAALARLNQAVAEGHTKASPRAAADLRGLLKEHGRLVAPALDAQAHAALAQAGELEGWQRWRADQLREELIAKAQALVAPVDGRAPGGRKVQEALRALREQWRQTDQGGVPNHALWKRFDEACTQAHQVVEAWLAQMKEQGEQHRQQRLALIDEVKAWTVAHDSADGSAADGQIPDWRAQQRELHAFSERWRQAGHLSEKQFAELQGQWKAVMHAAHGPIEAAQAQSTARREAMIEEARQLAAEPQLRIDAIKALQGRWQQEAQRVPLDRKREQKLWDTFRGPIDEAFQRKTAAREQAAAALSEADRRVVEAAKALDAATAAGDAGRIREAMRALHEAMRGEASPPVPAPAASADAAETAGADSITEAAPAAARPAAAARPLVAMRGDDRPGQRRTEPVAPGRRPGEARPGRPGESRPGWGRDAREGRDAALPRDGGRGAAARGPGGWPAPRGPRLGDAAFRLQRDALDKAEAALRRLAEQAHGETVTQVIGAWERRDAAQLPAAGAIDARRGVAARQAWQSALSAASVDGDKADKAAQALLRLEMAAELPTPAEHLAARRQLQLQLLTRRHDPAPAETWTQDVATVLSTAHDAAAARRLLQALKVLTRR